MSSPSNPVIVVEKKFTADLSAPLNPPDEIKIELGGVLEFKNEDEDVDYFEITFAEQPPNPQDNLTGTKGHPIRVHMPHETERVHYHIEYKKKDGTCIPDRRRLIARTCPGC